MNVKKKQKKKWIIAAVAVFFLAAGIWYVLQTSYGIGQEKDVIELSEVLEPLTASVTMTPAPLPCEEAKPEIVIYLCGAVKTPGIYVLPEESRLYEAVVMAGGLLPEADEAYHNLARKITDGERIYILSREETKALTAEVKTSGEEGKTVSDTLLNLNTATAEQLTSLSGIGEAKAAAIVEYRSKVGKFKSVEEIKNVSGIGDAMFERIKDKITVK